MLGYHKECILNCSLKDVENSLMYNLQRQYPKIHFAFVRVRVPIEEKSAFSIFVQTEAKIDKDVIKETLKVHPDFTFYPNILSDYPLHMHIEDGKVHISLLYTNDSENEMKFWIVFQEEKALVRLIQNKIKETIAKYSKK